MTEASPAALLEAVGVRCVRDRRVLFDHLDLVVHPGTILHLEGRNGAGKTSLLRILCGLMPPREGHVLWNGIDIRSCRPEYYSQLLFLGHLPGLKLDLTPLENLAFLNALGDSGHVRVGNVNQLARQSSPSRLAGEESANVRALDEVGLRGYEDVPVRHLSAGQRRRVALARCWLSEQTLWLLDEPLTALDIVGIERLQETIRIHAQKGGAVILTSHQRLDVATERLTLDPPGVGQAVSATGAG